MATEKKGSKGRFFSLFDWNAKSRKKLFSSKIDSSEGSNQGKENVDNLGIPPFLWMELQANGDCSTVRGSGSYSCASSVSGDDGYGSRAPGVVARLMGLDSLPTSSSSELSSISLHGHYPVSNSYYSRSGSDLQGQHHILDYSCMPDKLEGFNWNSGFSRPNKVHGWPIERFQTEVLPPKSAKPISITHHKLLSPIKSPGFVPTMDAAYVMEAAARIIDSSPRPASMTRASSFGSSSAPLRVQDLKKKKDVAVRSSRLAEHSNRLSSAAKQMRGNSHDRSDNTLLFRPSTDSETSSLHNLTSKGKIVSFGAQAKDSRQRKEGSACSSNRSLVQKEHRKVKLKQSSTSKSSAQKNGQTRNSTNRGSGVLRSNPEKQNCLSQKDRSTSKTSLSTQQSRKAVPVDGSAEPSRIVNKVYVNSERGPKKVLSATNVMERRPSLARMKNISRNKDFIIRETQFDQTTADHVLTGKDERHIQHDLLPRIDADPRKNMDVISFTFTSPIKKSGSPYHSYREVTESASPSGIDSYDINEHPESKASLPPLLRLNFISNDSLSRLLEQKLKELTHKVESSQCDANPMSGLADSVSTHNVAGSASVCEHDPGVTFDDDFSLPQKTQANHKWKDFDGTEEDNTCSIDKCEARRELDLHLKASVSEYSASNGSSMPSRSIGNNSYGNELYSSPQSQELNSCMSTEKSHDVEDEKVVTDTASSLCNEEWNGMHTIMAQSSIDFRNSSYWEMEYVRRILCYAELKGFEFRENSMSMICPSVFDQLEFLIITPDENLEGCSKVGRKLLFDFVNECVSIWYRELFLGGHKAWAKWGILFREDEWLAAELWKEISCLKTMGNLMVDELVDKDMSTGHGKWLDFEIETLEEGMEIEGEIIASLVHEVIMDLCLSWSL
ncbi:hypothetical protein Ancab_000665 [Ancistrocladus abbreviatus]